MQHLKELGINIDNASFTVNVAHEDKHIFTYDTYYSLIEYSFTTHPVFTLQDILDLIPCEVDDQCALFMEKNTSGWRIGYVNVITEEVYEEFSDKDFIEAAYKLLCWCAENGYI